MSSIIKKTGNCELCEREAALRGLRLCETCGDAMIRLRSVCERIGMQCLDVTQPARQTAAAEFVPRFYLCLTR